MANIFDYIKWRGDLSLNQDPFNEVDNLILARLAYFPFDKIIGEKETLSIQELSQRFMISNINQMKILWKQDIELFPILGISKRFGNMLVTQYTNKIEKSLEKQFSAVTILMPDNTLFVSYRGTDNTLVGWKEDFNMSFKSHVASQLDAVTYLEKIGGLYINRNIRVGGHSKGGNLAIYASVFASSNIKERIINIYNNDGPGFSQELVESQKYKEIINKVQTFIPQSSIVGMLLEQKGKVDIVQSSQKGIMQHDLYSWQLIGNKFIRVGKVTNESIFIDKTIEEWLKNIDNEKREIVVDVVFEVLSTTKANTFSELTANWFENAKTIMKSYKKIDNETKKIIIQTLYALLRIAKNNII